MYKPNEGRKLNYFLLICFFVLLFFSTKADNLKHVVVIHSYFPNQGWTRLANEGIMTVLHQEKTLPITLDVRYLDMRNDTSAIRLNGIRNELRNAYPRDEMIDLLIIADDLALQFVQKKGDVLFPTVNTIICSAKNYKNVDMGDRKFTGVNESIGFEKNIKLAKQLLPKTQHVLLLNSINLPTGAGHLEELGEIPSRIEDVDIEVWSDYTKESLQQKLRKLPENSILFYGITNFTDDRELDLIFNLHDFSFLWENSDAAVFSHNYDLINSGFMGGYTIRAEEIGMEAAKMGIEVLKGRDITTMPIKLIEPLYLNLNYNALKKYRIPIDNITNKSVLVNYNPTFWEQYKQYILTALIIFLIQFVFISILFDQKRRLKKSQFEIQKAKMIAEESNRMKKAFLANMNHEIRTPLNAIIGFANLIIDKESTENERIKYAELINQNSDYLLNMVGDILDLSKLESGSLDIYQRKVSVNTIINEICDTTNYLKVGQEKTSIRFKVQAPENADSYFIFSDPYRLKQILLNLSLNTLKYTDSGDAIMGFEIQDNFVRFFIHNPGLKITADEKEHLFEPFYLPKSMETYNYNVGTDLSLSARLAKLLGAFIKADFSNLGGIEFSLRMPLYIN
jgi:signal transduction histidine kinase